MKHQIIYNSHGEELRLSYASIKTAFGEKCFLGTSVLSNKTIYTNGHVWSFPVGLYLIHQDDESYELFDADQNIILAKFDSKQQKTAIERFIEEVKKAPVPEKRRKK